MSATWVIASNDLMRRLRNRSAVIVAVVAPLVMATVFGTLLGGTDDLEFNMALVDLDGSALSAEIVGQLTDQQDESPLVVTTYDSEADAADAVDDGTEGVAVVLPKGLGDASDEPRSIRVLQSPSRPISAQVGDSVSGSIAAEFNAVALTLATAGELGVEPDLATVLDGSSRAVIASVPVGDGELDPTAFFGASMSILFMFFTVGFAAQSILEERTDGTLTRLLSTPTTPAQILGGKVLSVSMLAFGGFVITYAATTFVFGANWGNPLTVLALIVATVIAVGGVALCVTSFATTPRQAESVTAVVAFVFALLGGNFLGPGAAPGSLTAVRFLTPNGWSLSGFTNAAADRASIGQVGPELLALMAIGLVLGAIGLIRIRRVLVW